MFKKRTLIICAICIVSVACAASYMISKFVEVKELKAELNRLNTQYSQMQATTLQKQRDYNEGDVANGTSLEEEAEKLHMQRPDNSQIIYVEVDREDETDITAGEAEGIANRFKSFFSGIYNGIVNHFSVS